MPSNNTGQKAINLKQLQMVHKAIGEELSGKATKQELQTIQEALNAAIIGATAAELFQFSVDKDTMHFKCYSTAAYAQNFAVEDGHLKLKFL